MIRFVSKRQIKAARALLEWSQDDLARNAGVSPISVKRLETESAELISSTYSIVRRIVSCFEASGIELSVQSTEDLAVRLRRRVPIRE